MKWAAVLELLFLNVVLISLLAWITSDYGYRNAYWGPEGFTPSTVRYPFFFITSAVNGSTRIPGLLSVDWQQIVLLVLVVTDVVFAWTYIKSRRGDRSSSDGGSLAVQAP